MRRRWLPGYVETARRRWAPSRVRSRAGDSLEVSGHFVDIADELPVIGIIVGLVLLVALVFVALPLLIDALIVVLAILLGGLVRVVFRRPWTVEAVSGEERRTQQVVGWRAAGRAVEAWAEELRHGRGE